MFRINLTVPSFVSSASKIRAAALELVASEKISEATAFAGKNLPLKDRLVIYWSIAEYYDATAVALDYPWRPLDMKRIVQTARVKFAKMDEDPTYFSELLETVGSLTTRNYACSANDPTYTGKAYRYLPQDVREGVIRIFLITARDFSKEYGQANLHTAATYYLKAACLALPQSILERNAANGFMKTTRQLPQETRISLFERAYYLAPHDGLLVNQILEKINAQKPRIARVNTPYVLTIK